MSNPVLIELRQDTGDNVPTSHTNAEFQVTLDKPLIMNDGDSLSMSSVFVDSVASNSGKVVINDDETDFEIKSFVYFNNYSNENTQVVTYGRIDGSNNRLGIVQGLNDGFDYIACTNNGNTSHTSSIIKQISIYINMQHFTLQHERERQDAVMFNFKYVDVEGNNRTFVLNISKKINLTKEIFRAGMHPDGSGANQAYYTTDDYFNDFGSAPTGFPFEYQNGTLTQADPFIVDAPHSGTEHGGFLSEFDYVNGNDAGFTGIKLTPFIFTYNFSIPAGAYDPSELARILTDKMANQNITSTDDINYTDKDDGFGNKYLTEPRSFSSPFIEFSQALRSLQPTDGQSNLFCCRSDGEGIAQITGNSLLIGSSQAGLEFDIDQQKFFFSQLHTPFYLQLGDVPTMGTQFVNVKTGNSSTPTNSTKYFTANKNGGIGFTELKPQSVWFKKMGLDPAILTQIGVKTFSDGAGNRLARNYKTMDTNANTLLGLVQPITFSLVDGVNTTGNFTSLDSAIDKSKPRESPAVLDNLKDTSQIIKQIYARDALNQLSSLPYYLIEIDGKGINSDIRGSRASAINNTKISAIVSRYYQTLSYTSTMDGSGGIPYIHKGQPLILDSFKVRILDPNGELTANIQDSNVVFLQHTPAPVQ